MILTTLTLLTVAMASSIFHDDSQKTVIILDNSGSMSKNDGKLYEDPSKISGYKPLRTFGASRWQEMKQKVKDVCDYNADREMPTTIHFLHQGRENKTPFELDFSNPAAVSQWMNKKSPGGGTPLTETITNIIPDLRRTKKPCTLVIFTDGQPDGGFQPFKRTVQKMLQEVDNNIAITINLCTDEEEVVGFYNDLDADVEVQRLLHDKSSQIDVNDDASSEMKEIFSVNPWIRLNHMNYVAKLAGCLNKEYDNIDERALTGREMHLLVSNSPYLFPSGSNLRLPHPHKDNFEEYKRVLAMAESAAVCKSADERKHLGGFEGEGKRYLTSIPNGHWLDCDYIAKHACGITMVDSAKTVASRLLQRAGCGRRQRHADYLHDQRQEQALTGFMPATPSAPAASSDPPAPIDPPAASGPEEPVIWDERHE